MGPRSRLGPAVFKWLRNLGFRILSVSENPRTIYVDAPDIPDFTDNMEKDKFKDTKGVLKRAQRMFDDSYGLNTYEIKCRVHKRRGSNG